MAETSHGQPLRSADAGTDHPPSLRVVPPAKSKRKIFALNKRQQNEVTRALSLCVVARQQAYAAVLAENKISAAFIHALEQDAKAAQQMSEGAWNCTKAKEGCTAEAADTKKRLLKNLRCIQAAARNEYQDTDPDKVGMYLVGQNITMSRMKLESSATAIIHRAAEDWPGSITPEFVADTQAKLGAYVDSRRSQQEELGQGKQFRRQRDDRVRSIIARRKKVQ